MNTFKQYQVTVGGVTMFSNEHGKFLPIEAETPPEGDENGQNGNNTPPEWLGNPPLVPRPSADDTTTDDEWEGA